MTRCSSRLAEPPRRPIKAGGPSKWRVSRFEARPRLQSNLERPAMDDVVKIKPFRTEPGQKPTREEAGAAGRTLIASGGGDPHREGLADTPRRVVKAYQDFYAGYG